MRLLAEEWKPNMILVEDAASGQSLIQEMKHMSALPIIPVKVDKDKESRAKAITPIIEAGRVFLPESGPLINDYIDEFASFPNATLDDMVDSTTLALNHLRHQQLNTVAYYTIRL
jgi:predicted phage terminase large subunit-like protein